MKSGTPKYNYASKIMASGLSIYDDIRIGNPRLWIPSRDLENILDVGLRGMSLQGVPIRTRSKKVKEEICSLLGYPVPSTFKKTQPRFPGQNFDTYVQKSNNLQIWNEKLSSSRRYVLIRVSEDDIITRVKVVTGNALSLLDTTGTLTQKYQARCIPGTEISELVSTNDTDNILPFLGEFPDMAKGVTPTSYPREGQVLPIKAVFNRLSLLVGKVFEEVGSDQERNRGAILHRLICRSLGYVDYSDSGQFPDIPHQLLEVKLQTSPTIDLGLVCPNSTEAIDWPPICGKQIRHCDVRYAVFYAHSNAGHITLIHFFLSTGKDFFSRFPQFQGRVLNKKLQIPLPNNFFAS